MEALKIIAVIVVAYFLGNFNGAITISKCKHRDIRTLGSGNPGTMNMFRNFGKFWGVMTLILDAAKGVLACLFGWFLLGGEYRLGIDRIGMYIAALSVIIGHVFPVCFKFKGGKGIAASIGVLLVINPIVTLIAFVVGALFLIVAKMGAVTSFIIISAPIVYDAYRLSASGGHLAELLLLFSLFSLTMFAHRSNIRKLFTGKESPVVLFKKKKKSEPPTSA